MTESLKLAEKLRNAMAANEVTPTQLAKEFGVKPPSVYDWMQFGRVAKKHIPKLAEYFGKPVGYWLGDEEEELLDDHERQLIALFRDLPAEARDKLLQDANWLHNQAKPEKSVANPFGQKAAPKTSK
jgi:transcriptional regulator with XRE-family HTH domain